MQIPPLRPTFEIDFPIDPEVAVARLANLLDDRDMSVEGRRVGNHLMLVIPPPRRHFWSPWLHIEVHTVRHPDRPAGEPPGARVHGQFTPNPSVWTAFMFGYLALAILGIFAAIFGVAEWMVHQPPAALNLIPVLLIVAALMYWASLIGQKLARPQMHELYDATTRALRGTRAPIADASSGEQDLGMQRTLS